MQGTTVLFIFSLIKIVLGCSPLVTHDQTTYCRAAYVFTGKVQRSNTMGFQSDFQIRVTSNVKGKIASKGREITVYGKGDMHPCGFTSLRINKEYILFVSIDEASAAKKIKIIDYQEMSQTTLNSMRNYDCSCVIEINLPQQSTPYTDIAARNKCVITEKEHDCTFKNGYCSRKHSRFGTRVCQWIPGVTNC
ncbi:uncharacterized protein LOC134235626 [Saccostrea cucullata]|uniref:uncharacterized protein LOC134235626 n=1 Tax=Saccostrea cuccullata TaxID=36930 RepID=UPI002ED2F54B